MTVFIVWESFCGDPPDIDKIFATRAAAEDYLVASTHRRGGRWIESYEVAQ